MDGVLSEANYRELTKALNSLANGYRLIEKAEEANIDMTQYRQYFDAAKESIEAKKRTFFPNRP